MKKKVLRIVAGATLLIAMVVGVNMNETQNQSTLVMENIANTAFAQSEGSFGCPNGCLTTSGCCYCYGYWPREEYHW